MFGILLPVPTSSNSSFLNCGGALAEISSDAIALCGISSSSEAASISSGLLEDEGSDPASSWFMSGCSCSSSSSALRLCAACSFLALPSR